MCGRLHVFTNIQHKSTFQQQSNATDLKSKIEKLQERKSALERKVSNLEIKKQNVERHNNNLRQIAEKHQNQDKEFYEHQKQALDAFLQSDFVKS